MLFFLASDASSAPIAVARSVLVPLAALISLAEQIVL
jgi:hypothetical protein